jgi:hypothetical protein
LVVFGILAFGILGKIQDWVSPWYAYQLRRQISGMEME